MQIQGINFTTVESPVATLDTIRSLLAFAAAQRLTIGQMDVSSAFLNGELHEDIYMVQPPGYEDPDFPTHVCKLSKALYGLKQAAQAWFKTFVTFLSTVGFIASHADPCLFIRGQGSDFLAIAIWVDDILAVATQRTTIDSMWSTLNATFQAKNLGSPDLFIGIRVHQNPSTFAITLDQAHYVREMATIYLLEDSPSHITSPFNRGQLMDPNSPSPVYQDKTKYQSLIGALLWVSRCTRPDISFVVSWLGRHNQTPSVADWGVALHTLSYLLTTATTGLRYTSGSAQLSGFTDSDFGEFVTSRKSTGGFIFFFRPSDSPISWKSKLQSLVTRSSTEAEYLACSEGCQEATWLGSLFSSLDCSPFPVPIHVDNASARTLVDTNLTRQRTKHIDIRYHYCRDRQATGFVTITPIAGPVNPADIFTKTFSPTAFNRAKAFLNLSICS